MCQKITKTFLVLFLILLSKNIFATHAKTAEILYKHIEGYTYEITIITLTYSLSPADRPELTLKCGDGVTQVLPRISYTELDPTTRKNIYMGQHTYPGEGSYMLSMEDPNRNYGIVNIPNSVNQPQYVESLLVIDDEAGPNNSVEFLIMPAVNVKINSVFQYNVGAIDFDVDHLVYELVSCKGSNGEPIPGYEIPAATNAFSLNAVNGEITWDSPYIVGEYVIAVKVTEWRNGMVIGFVTREFQFLVDSWEVSVPGIETIADTAIFYNQVLDINVEATAPGSQTALYGRGYPFLINNPAVFDSVSGEGSCSSVLHWETKLEHARAQPYYFYLIAKANYDYSIWDIATTIKCISVRVDFYAGENEYLSYDNQPRVLMNTFVDRYLNISFNEFPKDKVEIIIYSLEGKCVAKFNEFQEYDRTLKLDLGHLPDGIKIIRICSGENEIYSSKIVKR